MYIILTRKLIRLSSLLTLFGCVEAEMEGFIVGGNFAAISKYPHSAYLGIRCRRDGKLLEAWSCGSSILNQYILLTAAHCVYDCRPTDKIVINVAVGHDNKNVPRTFPAFRYVAHPDFYPNTLVNDIAMIKMMKPLFLNANVKRIVIMKNPPYHDRPTVAGWGVTNEEIGISSQFLKEAQQTLLPREKCVALFGALMHEGTICAERIAGPMAHVGWAAEGDSGSALVVRGYIQIGLVSFKIPLVSDTVIVYTDVAYFYDWITLTATNLYCT